MSENELPPEPPVVKSPVKARAGLTGLGVRYVLAISLTGVIVAFVLIAMWFYH